MSTGGALGVFVEPMVGENLPGYLMRVAESNGQSFTLFTIATMVEAKLSITNSHSCFSQKIEELSRVTRLSSSRLESLAYMSRSQSRFGRTVSRAFECDIPTNHLALGAPRICGGCLGDSGRAFVRQVWDLKLYRDCHVHGTELTAICEGCKHPVSWFRRVVTHCQKCGFDFRKTKGKQISHSRKQFSGLVAQLAGVQNDEGSAVLDRVDALRGIDLPTFGAICALIWGVQSNLRTGGLGFFSQTQHSMSSSVSWLAEFFGASWPKPFFDLVDLSASRSRDPDASPVQKFRRLYAAISGVSEGVRMPSFRSLFVQHLARSYLPYLGRAGSAAGPIAEAADLAGLTTCSEVEKTVGTTKATVLRVAKRLGCKVFERHGRYPVVRLYKSDIARIAEAVELELCATGSALVRKKLLPKEKWKLSKAELSKQLGCSDNLAASLLAVGIFGQPSQWRGNNARKYVATAVDVNVLIAELEARVVRRKATDARHLVSFPRRGLCGGIQKYWIAHVIALIRSGHLVPCGVDKNAVGLKRILLSIADGREFLRTSSNLPDVLDLLKKYGVRDKRRNHIIPFQPGLAA